MSLDLKIPQMNLVEICFFNVLSLWVNAILCRTIAVARFLDSIKVTDRYEWHYVMKMVYSRMDG